METFPCVVNNLALQLPALLYILRTPLADGRFVLAEHTLARAGYIAEDEVELHLRLSIVLGIIVGDDVVLVAPLCDVLQQDVGTVADGFIAVEYTVLGQCRTQQCRLATRGCAHVESLS